MTPSRHARRWRGILGAWALGVSLFVGFAGDPKAKGDVIYNGGILGLTGHVGIWDGSRVLEVGASGGGLNRSCIYNNQTLQSFKKNQPYKGARYDPTLSASKLLRVIDVGRQQAQFRPRYSFVLWPTEVNFKRSKREAWVVGSSGRKTILMLNKSFTRDAYLRCDFFVEAAFAEGAGRNPSLNGMTPDTVFASFPKAR